MRKLAATALALPILATLYVPLLFRRSIAFRVALGLGFAGLLGLGYLALSGPKGTAAAGPPVSAPLDTSAFAETLQPNYGLHAPATITFASPMNPASVAAALTRRPVDPGHDQLGHGRPDADDPPGANVDAGDVLHDQGRHVGP